MKFRFFVSSPGDVAEERRRALQVIEQELPKDPLLRGKIDCEAVLWDDPNAPVAMPATLTPQEAVNRGLGRPCDCDVVIVILWSRFGTPLSGETRTDGSPYLSGTEWEYENAISAQPPPHVLVYRRTTPPEVDLQDRAKRAKQLEQIDRVDAFFERFANPDGSVKGCYTRYATPDEFGKRLLNDLKQYVKGRIEPKPAGGVLRDTPPYKAIAKAFRRGTLVPFIGPGASASGRPPNAAWDPAHPAFLPSGVELSHLLADEAAFPADDDRDDLAEVASYFATFKTRGSLHERLRQVILDALPSIEIPPLYRFLAGIPAPLLIITTNFDPEIEQAFRNAGRPYDLVVYLPDRRDLGNALLWWPHGSEEHRAIAPNELCIDLATTTVIYKMYGSLLPDDDWDGCVITEEDYVRFFSRLSSNSAIPQQFTAHLRERSLLLLGCSLGDWPWRAVIGSLSRFFARRAADDTGEIESWAIAKELTELEDRLWGKWGVFPYRVDIDAFVEELRRRME
jgi:hypothetical protein